MRLAVGTAAPVDGLTFTHGTMESRSAELRRRHRRILRWSFGIAVLAHAVVLFFAPWFRADPLTRGGTELAEGGGPAFGGIAVNVIFGPPAILDRTASRSQEPDWRVLSASRSVRPPLGCASHDWFALGYARGEVLLTVGEDGRPDEVLVEKSSGDACWDGLMQGIASDLRYRWLPSDRFPAPVDVYQPVTLTLTGY